METKQINIGIKKIKEIEFFINEDITLKNPQEFNIRFELTTNIILAENYVEMVLSAIFSAGSDDNVFLKIRTSNLFIILELSSFHNVENDSFDIPDNALVTLLSLSISHTRALLAKNSIGTKFSELIIPIVNPTEVLKQLFGKK